MANVSAYWWNPENGQDSEVIRHAPDDENYHYPDGRQLERMRSGIGMAVVIPKARNDGRSMAFDGTHASVVHVDPDAPDGGTVVDLTNITEQEVYNALRTSRFPHEVFYKLGVAPSEAQIGMPPRKRRREAPLIATGYVVPASDNQGRQVWEEPDNSNYGDYRMAKRKEGSVLNAPPLPPVPGQQMMEQQVYPGPAQPVQPVQPVPQPLGGQPAQVTNGPAPYQAPVQIMQPAPPQPQYPPQYPPHQQMQSYQQPQYQQQPAPVDPGLANMVSQIMANLQTMSARLQQLEQGPAPVRQPSGRPAPGVATLPRGHKGVREHYQPPTPIGQRPRNRRQVEEEEEPEETRQDEVFDDDAEEIGQRKAAQQQRRAPRSESRGESRSVGRNGRQHLEDMEEEEEPRDGIIVGFETLKLPYVTGPIGMKAKRKVYFDLGEKGKLSATYHDVIASDNVIALIYDTRYEDGTQFEPPDLSDHIIKLHVPHHKKTYNVSSMGMSFPHGVFDVIVLIRHDDEQLDYNEEDS